MANPHATFSASLACCWDFLPLPLKSSECHSQPKAAVFVWAAVGKITGKEGLLFEGRALCFDSEEDMLAALAKDTNTFRVSHACQRMTKVCRRALHEERRC